MPGSQFTPHGALLADQVPGMDGSGARGWDPGGRPRYPSRGRESDLLVFRCSTTTIGTRSARL
ncbi:MAG: hypothetical protein OZSIB_1949 [Candidatus Ozemobacter sibiricus]|uniref:Uncharacterized protein n=1 Tax=Candidatus Ozemobacter sibiricus TaxID=2268124 RepID=A0A367ZKL2_9BACT|nr:MAG: hypothetical protein OZSIB_1949 [Candidatus Ozemobacter sibiricus]